MMPSFIRISALVAASYAAVCISTLERSWACSFEEPVAHVVDADEEAADSAPPQVPVLGDVMITRRPAGGSQAGCTQMASSCDGSGSIGVSITAADDRTSPADMGYVFELAGGELPSNMNLPTSPVRANEHGEIWFVFSDRDQDLDVTLSVRAMDLGGNLGEPTLVRVRDSAGGGCSAGARGGSATLALIAIALLWSQRRRRGALVG